MRVAVLKPDWRIRGGGELAVDLLQGVLQQAGHEVRRLHLDIPGRRESGSVAGITVERTDWSAVPEFFDFISAAQAFGELCLDQFDLVVSTQPPSYAISHPRHLSFFLHHQRHFYDLGDAWVAAGFADATTHTIATKYVRAADDQLLERVTWFAPISDTVRGRLDAFNGLGHRSTVVHLPPMTPAPPDPGDVGPLALCVSRHEFPKRTELAVAAGAMLGQTQIVVAGGGGRLDLVRRLADSAGDPRISWDTIDASRLWLSSGPRLGRPGHPAKNVSVTGRVSDEQLAHLYRNALCIVAPAFNEDYGLTALEAMLHARPVVVCQDGGGLVDFVEHGVTGLVVEPTPAAIAQAVGQLADNPEQAAAMGRAGRQRVAAYSLSRFRDELDVVIEHVLGADR